MGNTVYKTCLILEQSGPLFRNLNKLKVPSIQNYMVWTQGPMPHHFNFSYCTLYNNVRRSLPVCLEKNYFTWKFRGQGGTLGSDHGRWVWVPSCWQGSWWSFCWKVCEQILFLAKVIAVTMSRFCGYCDPLLQLLLGALTHFPWSEPKVPPLPP